MNNFRRIKFPIILCSVFVMLGLQGSAQQAWSLEQCISYAIENNITVKQQALNVNYRENQLKQSKLDLAPTANLSVGHNFQFGKSTNIDNTFSNVNSQVTNFDASTQVTLFNGYTKRNTIRQRSYELSSALKDLEKTKDDITLSVASAYLQILFNKELVSSTAEQIAVTKQQIDYNKKQVDAGNLAKGKLFETEAQLANEELSLTNYDNQLQVSLLNLMQLLELVVTDTFDVVIPEFDDTQLGVAILNTNTVYDKAVGERPGILSKELTLKSMESQSKIAKAQQYPTLSAFASYNNFYNNKYEYWSGDKAGEIISLPDQMDLNGQKLVGFRLQIPVFNGWTVQTNIKNAQINYLNSRHDLQLEKNNLLKEIQQVHLDAVSAMKKYYSSQKAVESAEEAFRYVEEKFTLGIVTPLEYNDAKNKVTNAQSSFIQAKYEYIFKIKILDFYNGKRIVL